MQTFAKCHSWSLLGHFASAAASKFNWLSCKVSIHQDLTVRNRLCNTNHLIRLGFNRRNTTIEKLDPSRQKRNKGHSMTFTLSVLFSSSFLSAFTAFPIPIICPIVRLALIRMTVHSRLNKVWCAELCYKILCCQTIPIPWLRKLSQQLQLWGEIWRKIVKWAQHSCWTYAPICSNIQTLQHNRFQYLNMYTGYASHTLGVSNVTLARARKCAWSTICFHQLFGAQDPHPFFPTTDESCPLNAARVLQIKTSSCCYKYSSCFEGATQNAAHPKAATATEVGVFISVLHSTNQGFG